MWHWPCLPHFRLLQTPCYSGMLGGLLVLVGSLTLPHWDVCLSLPTLDVCCAWGWVDVPSPPRTARALSATWLVVSTPARIASSDRQCGGGPVFFAFGCWAPISYWVGWSIGPGWCLNSSLQRMFVLTSLTMTLDLTVFQHSSRNMAMASVHLVRSCLLCQRSLLCLCLFVF